MADYKIFMRQEPCTPCIPSRQQVMRQSKNELHELMTPAKEREGNRQMFRLDFGPLLIRSVVRAFN